VTPKSSDRYGFLEGMTRAGLSPLGRAIVDAVECASWVEVPTDDSYRARSWRGETPGFHFVVVDFEIESQGFAGCRAADGAVTTDGHVIRLGHELGARAVALAREKCGAS